MASSCKPYRCTLSEASIEKAKKELNENPDTRFQDVEELRKLVLSNKALQIRTDDEFLLRFLRARKFDRQRAYDMIVAYFTSKLKNPDTFAGLRPSVVKIVLEDGVSCVLDHRDKGGSKVMIQRIGKWNTGRYDIYPVEKTNVVALHKLIQDEETQVNGISLIIDMKDMGWNHGIQMNPFIAQKMASTYQGCFPARFKAFHMVYEPTFFDIMFPILKIFLKEKMLSRIHIHGDNMETLHEFIDPEYLPSDYGGKLPPMSTDDWVKSLLESEEEFKADEKYGLIDIVPQSNQVKEDAMDSLPGTFKKLDVG